MPKTKAGMSLNEYLKDYLHGQGAQWLSVTFASHLWDQGFKSCLCLQSLHVLCMFRGFLWVLQFYPSIQRLIGISILSLGCEGVCNCARQLVRTLSTVSHALRPESPAIGSRTLCRICGTENGWKYLYVNIIK